MDIGHIRHHHQETLYFSFFSAESHPFQKDAQPVFTTPACKPWTKKITHYCSWCLARNRDVTFEQLIFCDEHPELIRMRSVHLRCVFSDRVDITVMPSKNADNRIFGSHFDRSFINAMEDVLLISEAEPLDLPGPRVIYVNDAFESMTGYETNDILGRTPRILQCDNTTLHSRAEIRKGLASWKPFKVIIRNQTKSGREFDAELSISPVADETGWFIFWISIQRDMTQREQTLAQLEKANVILKNVDMGTWSIDPSTQQYHWDENCSRLHQLEPHIRYQHLDNWVSLLPGHAQDVFYDNMIAIVDGMPDTFEVIYELGGDEKEVDIKLIGRTVADESGNKSIVGIAVDCTAQILAEKELEKQRTIALEQSRLAAIGELAAGMGHEINNPLSVIMAVTEKLEWQSDVTAAELADSINKITAASERIRKIISNTQKVVSRQEFEHDKSVVDIGDQIASTLSLMQELYANKGVTMEYAPPKNTVFVNISAIALQQILINLINNAVDAVSQSTDKLISISVSENTKHVTLQIKDSGKGIAPADQTRIYELFYTTKRAKGGTGLGLSIVRTLVEGQGGKLWFDSEPGMGTHFYVELSRAKRKNTLSNEQGKDTIECMPEKIMLVDDEEMVRDALSDMLASMGHNVIACACAREAIAQMEKGEHYDALVTDFTMPDIDGGDLIKHAISLDSQRFKRIVLLTGDLSITKESHGLRDVSHAIDCILYKPFTTADLAACFK